MRNPQRAIGRCGTRSNTCSGWRTSADCAPSCCTRSRTWAAPTHRPKFARAWLDDLALRLEAKGYGVRATPFGFTCAWTLEVYGESLAKVWKQF